MDVGARIESCLEEAILRISKNPCPPRLANAVHYSIFPGGARVRPQICLAVAMAAGGPNHKNIIIAEHAAASIEMLHCASLVHDDLPCFDDADMRRGRKSVHALYGEALAVLAGDALIVEAFSTIIRGAVKAPELAVDLHQTIADSVAMPNGIIAGQAWESEPSPIDVTQYHQSKTGSLFVAATMAGAISVGADAAQWRTLGANIGAAYQLADDLMDAAGEAKESGKPVGQDIENDRPNAVKVYGVKGVIDRLKETVETAAISIPDCHGREQLQMLIREQSKRLVPSHLMFENA